MNSTKMFVYLCKYCVNQLYLQLGFYIYLHSSHFESLTTIAIYKLSRSGDIPCARRKNEPHFSVFQFNV